MFGILSGRTHWCFLLINRVSSEIVCRLIPLIIAQLSDEDIFLNDRSTAGSLRASVFGAANVVGKIGQSAAPMFGYMLLSHHHNMYNDVQISDKENNSIYFLSDKVWVLRINGGSQPETWLEIPNAVFYAVAVNPISGNVYLSDTRDFVSRSTIYRYSREGALLDEFSAGIIAGDFFFP